MAVEGFLGRWSRRKREAEREVDHEAGREDARENASEVGQQPAGRNADVRRPAPFEAGVGGPVTEADRVAVADHESGLAQGAERAAGEGARAPAEPGAQVDAGAQSPRHDEAGRARAASIADALPDIAALTGDSDFSPFMRAGVDPKLRVAALKKLFSDPRFNRMDGLDVYIDDYGKPDPLPAGMLRRLEQGRSLGLFRDEEEAEQVAAAADAGMTGEASSSRDGNDAGTETEPGTTEGAGSDSPAGGIAAGNADAAADGAGLGTADDGVAENDGNVEGDRKIEDQRNIDTLANIEGIDRIASGSPDQRGNT